MLDEPPEATSILSRWSALGSGDLRADRRYLFGRDALAQGDAEAAADLAGQVIELVPGWPPAWILLGEAERAAGRRAQAVEAFRAALARDPEDPMGAGLHLAAMGAGTPESAMSPAYVAALFDDYAPRFERHLTEVLGYRGPQQIMAVLAGLGFGPSRRFHRVLDVGCGTGLVGRALADWVDRIEGCDLSAAMVARARNVAAYSAVVVADGARYLAAQPEGSADLVTAADVLIYVGDPAPLFAAVARVLEPGGYFAFTLQTGPAQGSMLGDDRRFRHAPAFIAALGREAGLSVVAQEEVALRLDRGVTQPGAVMACRKVVP